MASFCIALCIVIALPNLKAIAKSNGKLKAIALVGRAITIKIDLKEWSKEIIPKIKKISFRALTLQEAIEKYPILLSQYWKNE